LIRVLPASAGTVDAIKNLLTKALDKTNGITRVVFEAVEDSATTTHYIHPNNGNPGIRIGITLNIILVCPAPLGNDVETAPTEPYPGEEEIVETTARKKRSAKKAKKAKKSKTR